MKTGDTIAISIIDMTGSRRFDAIGILRLDGDHIYADVTSDQLKHVAKIDLVPPFVEPSVGDVKFRYRGEIRGAVPLPDFLWK